MVARCLLTGPGPYPLNLLVGQEKLKFTLPHPHLHPFLKSASSSKVVLNPDYSLESPLEILKSPDTQASLRKSDFIGQGGTLAF